MAQPPTVLKVLITSRHWQVFETFRRRFEHTANELAQRENDPSLEGLTVSKRQFERWYGGSVKTRPYPALCRVLEAMFDQPVDVLLGPMGRQPPADRFQLVRPPQPVPPATVAPDSPRTPGTYRQPGSAGLSRRTRQRGGTDSAVPPVLGGDTGRDTIERQVAMAARRAFRFSVTSEGSSIGRETLDQLQQEVRRLTVAYPQMPLSTLLGDLIEMQDLSFRLLEHGRVRPKQAKELYLLSSVTSGILAKASHDLGDTYSAMTQARTAYVCADNADHPAMRAWVRGLQSLVTYWAGQHQEAAQYAALGNAAGETPLTGTTPVWLACLHARASAALGDVEGARASIRRAESAREDVTRDDLDDFGGIMTFTLPRQHYYAADALAQLSDAPEAEQQAEAAVAAYLAASPQEWAFGDQAGSYTDLALARVRAGALDGIGEALRPVLDLPVDKRIHGIIASVRQVHTALREPRWAAAPEAREARGEIEAFIAAPAAALPR